MTGTVVTSSVGPGVHLQQTNPSTSVSYRQICWVLLIQKLTKLPHPTLVDEIVCCKYTDLERLDPIFSSLSTNSSQL